MNPDPHNPTDDLQADLRRGLGLYAMGDRTKVVLRTIADAHVAYETLGLKVPTPVGICPNKWPGIIEQIVSNCGRSAGCDTRAVAMD